MSALRHITLPREKYDSNIQKIFKNAMGMHLTIVILRHFILYVYTNFI